VAFGKIVHKFRQLADTSVRQAELGTPVDWSSTPGLAVTWGGRSPRGAAAETPAARTFSRRIPLARLPVTTAQAERHLRRGGGVWALVTKPSLLA
jgi:hypothetical protein